MSHSHSNNDCPICGVIEKEIQFYGFGHCNHALCGVCAIKMQKFSKETGNDYDYSKCSICKQDITKIIIASEIWPFEDYDRDKLLFENKYDLLFDSPSAQKFYESIIRIFCRQCNKSFQTMDELKLHAKEHNKRFCELCESFNKCLISELDLLTDNDYHQHRNKKHPKCQFCEIRFYDDSHLIKHVKDQHFVCDICHRNRGYVAYSTQASLLEHYAKDHFVCDICRSCNNINVFESEYALKTHKVATHAHCLVGEGLVNISYGDRDNHRYGARRRARDNHEADFDNLEPQEPAQSLPPMSSKEEFPPLGIDAVATSIQLGMPSMTADDNDSRTAFYRPTAASVTVAQQQPQQPQQPSVIHCTEKMSNNFAISVKKSAGNLNSEDFPTLSTDSLPRPTGRVQEFSRVMHNKAPFQSQLFKPQQQQQKQSQQQQKQSQQQQKQSQQHQQQNTMRQHSDEDFPSLSGNKHMQAAAQKATNRQWGANIAASASVTTDEISSSKVSLISREEWATQSNDTNHHHLHQQRQTVPTQHDFPQLAGSGTRFSSSAGSNSITTKMGAWGNYSVPDNGNSGHQRNSRIKGIPAMSTLPMDTITSQKGKNKQKKKVSDPQPMKQQQQNHEQYQQQEQQEYQQQQTPASLRGITYIPNTAAPTKDAISLVDRQQFSIIKSTATATTATTHNNVHDNENDNYPNNNSTFSIMSDSDFPGVARGDSHNTAGHSDNRYRSLLIDNDDHQYGSAATDKKQASVKKPNAPVISSEADFPSLPGLTASVTTTPSLHKQQQSTQHKKNNKQQKRDTMKTTISTGNTNSNVSNNNGDKSVVSLMDVAMRVVTQRSYTPFPDTTERNESMLVLLYERLGVTLAHEFLQLSGQYRNRQLSVRDYLDALMEAATNFGNSGSNNDDNSNNNSSDNNSSNKNIAVIGHMLPQMCVLLPDIPLQRSLMSGMPKEWIGQLRECTRCEQVLHEADVAEHNQLAH